jgi:hypothetical protein
VIGAQSLGGIVKNEPVSGFVFYMASSVDHYSPVRGAAIAPTVSLNAAPFVPLTHGCVEIGNGLYSIDLAAADTDGNTLCLSFAAAGADTTLFTVLTIPTNFFS